MGSTSTTWSEDSLTAATALTTTTEDLTVTGSSITLGTDVDGTDRAIVLGHSTLKTIMGIDDSADAFVINTDSSFDGTLANNSLSIDASHTAIFAGDIKIAATNKLYLDGGGTTYLTEASDGNVVLYANNDAIRLSEDTGIDNTVFGEDVWQNPHAGASYNVAIGYRAGYAGAKTTTSDNNVLVGKYAGYSQTTAAEITALGAHSCYNTTTGAGNTGVGTGAMSGNILNTISDEPEYNVAIGNYTLYNLLDGDHNTAIGRISAQFTLNGSSGVTQLDQSTYLGSSTRPSAATGITNETAIGYLALGGGSNTFTCGNSSVTTLMVDSDDSCDLGKSDHQFDDVYYSGAINGSDLRLKENVIDTPIGLDFINALRPVQYKWKDRDEVTEDYKDTTTFIDKESVVEDATRIVQPAKTYARKHQGLIAQEVKAVLDSQNIDTNDFAGYVDANIKDGVDKYFLRYIEFLAPMIKAIQELSVKVDNLS